MSLIILPVPSAQSNYGFNNALTYKRIIGVQAANETMSEIFPSNLIQSSCIILEPVEFQQLSDDQPTKGSFLGTNLSMATNLKARIQSDFDMSSDQLCILGGDHSIAIGTGAGLSTLVDMSKVGLIWVDAHGDFNTPETSLSKCITGYPCGVNSGIGLPEFTDLFNGNFVTKIVQIGIRDIDQIEQKNLNLQKVKTYSVLDIEEIGMKTVIAQTLEYLSECEYIWLSMDIDSLDSVYFQPGETDVPVVGGLTPRELLYITSKIQKSNKLKVFELVQLNDLSKTTNLVTLSSRLVELGFGLGQFRYNR
jgi:arginase